MNQNDFNEFVNEISIKEIEKLRKNSSKFYDYTFKILAKIFKKLIYPYIRFEILQRCVLDILNNNKYYTNMKSKEIKCAKLLYEKLQKICVHMNIVLEELSSLLPYIEKI